MPPSPQDLVGGGGVQEGLQGHCHVLLLELRCWSCLASSLACSPLLPSHKKFLGKYQFHTLAFPVQCCVDRCLEVGCGSVAMVTSLLLRSLLPSSVATFKAPTLQYSIGLEFKFVLHLNTVYCKCQFIIKFDVGQSSHTTLAYYLGSVLRF